MARESIFCHNCQRTINFELEYEKDGNHIIRCPNCGHEHCRVIKNGRVTEDRWDQRNGDMLQTYYCFTSLGTSSTAGSIYYSSFTTAGTGAW
jgi:DNA-directed RNA polymerase subunit RPC12/RpoP